MIEAETDSVFELEDVVIAFNPQTDSLYTIEAPNGFRYNTEVGNSDRKVITKELRFSNVNFRDETININGEQFVPCLRDIEFRKPVTFNPLWGIRVFNCVFKKDFHLRLEVPELRETQGAWEFLSSHFHDRSRFLIQSDNPVSGLLLIDNCNFSLPESESQALRIYGHGGFIWFTNNKVSGNSQVRIRTWDNNVVRLINNKVEESIFWITIGDLVDPEQLEVVGNKFENYVWFSAARNWSSTDYLDWRQFEGKLMSNNGLLQIPGKRDSVYLERYHDTLRYIDKRVNHFEIALRSDLYQFYRSSSEFDWANAVYVELKDLETGRLKYLYTENPSFDTYFRYKINQFLKLFSDYGTRPSKAIIYSIYVILIFALFYVFFPNSWDTQGRKRLIDRYTFFFKYLRKEAGIHEVYLENKEKNLEEYNSFKNLISESNQEVPKFFTRTALTIYKWGVSGTNLSAKFLRQFDVVKGRWKDLPPSKRIWKSILITGAFILAIIYDLFVKALNALMLSVNAFTTLGFGEIPIKGIPRYLAIIQGFIGWFMLTIFSVALISQLLN